jgi:hypothetical protein
MTRTGKLFGLAALLAALFVGPKALAFPPEEQGEKGEKVEKDLADLKREVAELRKLRELDGKLASVEMKLLNERLDRIERTLARLGPPVSTRVSSSFAPDRVPRGTVRLDNRLPVTASVTLNGATYSVPPFTVQVVRDQPAGSIIYDVLAAGFGLRPPVRTPLAANETLTLTIY